MQEVKTVTQPQTVCQHSAMETGLSKGDDSLSSSSTAGMGDLNLLNVIAMSPDMSASASSNNLNSHRFSTPRTPSTAKSMRLNSPPDFNGNNGQSHQSLYNLVGGSCPSGQPFVLSPHPNKPSSVASISSEYRPHRPASTPSNNANQDEDSGMQQNNQHTNQSPVPQTNGSGLGSSRFSLHRAHGAFSSISQTSNQNSNQSVSSPTNQEFMYKLSKAPNYSMALEMHCNGPLLMSPVSRSTTPLASQDLNQPPLSILHNGQGGRVASANGSAIQEPMGQPNFPRASASAPGSTRSLPSPDLDQPNQTSSPRVDGRPSKAYSTCSNPSTPQGAGSVNGCPSPQVSDLSSDETDMSTSQQQQSFAQSYASLTPWTSKLTAPGYVLLPRPSSDAMPIPLECISKESMLAMSPTTLELPTPPPLVRGYQSYSSLQPMAGLNNKNVSGRAGKNGTHHPPKANFKVMPNKEHRFKRTADALQKSGLWEVAMKTGNLIKRNRELQRELEQFRTDALTFLKSVIKNPQNRHFIKNVLNNALSSNSSQCNGSSMMTVVVSAAAAAAAASVRLDSSGSTDESTSSNNST